MLIIPDTKKYSSVLCHMWGSFIYHFNLSEPCSSSSYYWPFNSLLLGVSNIFVANLRHIFAYLIMLEIAGVYIRAKPRTFWQILLKSIFGLAIYSIQTPFPGGKNMGGLWSYFKVLHLSVVTTNTARYHLFDHFQRTF